MHDVNKKAWMIGAASAVIAMATGGAANAQSNDEPVARAPVTSEAIVVPGEITYRNRSEAVAPTLEYGLDYFQRFEPSTVGDALKRVPSVAFLSDVLESDGVRLRGLDPAYTQILINGEQVPGSGDSSGAFGSGSDGAFFVDRIPAELIERVEVVRSQSANRSGDAMAGGINIVLRDAYTLDGGYIRAGALYFANDGAWRETIGGVWGGEVLGGRLLVGGNMQDRHNPKDKLSLRFSNPSDTSANTSEIQTDVRDGTDYSANFSYSRDFGESVEFSVDGFYVHTDRYQDENSTRYEGAPQASPLGRLNSNDVDIDQDSIGLNTRLAFDMLGGETRLKFGYAEFSNESFEFENEGRYYTVAPVYPRATRVDIEQYLNDITDEEFKFKIEHERDLGSVDLEFGVHLESKERDFLLLERFFTTGTDSPNLPNATLAAILAAGYNVTFPGGYQPGDGGDNTIERDRVDPYVMVSGEAGAIEWEAGVRYEMTDLTVTDRTATGPATESSYETVLPSAHFKWSLTDADRLLVSIARTIRNPGFAYLNPAVIEEFGDNKFRGNPNLKPETAWGLDVGFEHRIGRTGVAGVNVFYRDVSDLIEVFNTQESAVVPLMYSARNTGDGEVYGIEFDLSSPLTVIGLENTGVFFNYSWLDSSVDDEFGERRFNSQTDYVLNVGFIHDMPSLNSSFGVTYRKQGDAYSRVVGEEVTTTYDGDLELFLEHRFGERFTLRFTGSNLLDASKDEDFNKFADAADQEARSFSEYELESESAGPVFQLIGRVAF